MQRQGHTPTHRPAPNSPPRHMLEVRAPHTMSRRRLPLVCGHRTISPPAGPGRLTRRHVLAQVVAAAEPGDRLRLSVEYESLTALGDEIIAKQVPLVVPEGADGAARLEALGLVVTADGDRLIVDNVGFGSPAEEAGIEFDWRILSVEQPNVRPPKELFFLPALLQRFQQRSFRGGQGLLHRGGERPPRSLACRHPHIAHHLVRHNARGILGKVVGHAHHLHAGWAVVSDLWCTGREKRFRVRW